MRMHFIAASANPWSWQVLVVLAGACGASRCFAPPHSLHLLLSNCAINSIGPKSGFLASGRFLTALPLGLVYVWLPPAFCCILHSAPPFHCCRSSRCS